MLAGMALSITHTARAALDVLQRPAARKQLALSLLAVSRAAASLNARASTPRYVGALPRSLSGAFSTAAAASAAAAGTQPIALVKIGADGNDSSLPVTYDSLADMDRMALLEELAKSVRFSAELKDVPLGKCTVWLLPRVTGDEPTLAEEAAAVELRAAATIGDLLTAQRWTPSRLLFIRVRMPSDYKPPPPYVWLPSLKVGARVPVRTSDFANIRTQGFRFVDKTSAIADMLNYDGGKELRAFFARPRKFGKSLTLDVAAHMLRAGRLPRGVAPWQSYDPRSADLFKGLEVEKRHSSGSLHGLLDTAHFVVDLNLGNASSGETLGDAIVGQLAGIAAMAFGESRGKDVSKQRDPGEALRMLVDLVPREVPLALLVDEYDMAIIRNVSVADWKSANQGVGYLQSLFMVLKSKHGSRVQRCLVTGVTRVARASLFSGFNTFVDMTNMPLMTRVMGFSEEELLAAFPEELARLGSFLLATTTDSSRANPTHAAITSLRRLYNGYCFDGTSTCYAPFHVLRALRAGTVTPGIASMQDERGDGMNENVLVGTHWLGMTPYEAIEKMWKELTTKSHVELGRVEMVNIAEIEAKRVNVVPLMLQAGLLTIAPHGVGSTPMCQPPNEEARAQLRSLVAAAHPAFMAACDPQRLVDALSRRDRDAFGDIVCRMANSMPRSLFANPDRGVRKLPARSSDGDSTASLAATVDGAADDTAGNSTSKVQEAPFHAQLHAALWACVPTSVAQVFVEMPVAAGVVDLCIRISTDTRDQSSPFEWWLLELGLARGRVDKAVNVKLAQALQYTPAFLAPRDRVWTAAIIIDVKKASASKQSSDSAADSFCTIEWREHSVPSAAVAATDASGASSP